VGDAACEEEQGEPEFFHGVCFVRLLLSPWFRAWFRASEQAAGYSPARMSPASLLLYFAQGSTRRPVHLGTLLVIAALNKQP
jgi:hypothetical protein